MERDWSLIRKILLEFEKLSPKDAGKKQVRLEGYDNSIIVGHVFMLSDKGYIDIIENKKHFIHWMNSLTSEGYDLLEKLRDESNLEKALNILKERKAPIIIETLDAILTEIAVGGL